MKRVFIPFDLPSFEYINSNHPLLVSLLADQREGIEFVRAGPKQAPPASPSVAYGAAAALVDDLRRRHEGQVPNLDSELHEFVHSRDWESQVRTDTGADLAFFHTAPMHFNQMPWLLHVENVTTLFHPRLVQGKTAKIALKEEPIYRFVRSMMEAPQCRGIFTNLASTREQIDTIFGSETISRKTRHIAAGPYFTPDEESRIEAAIARRPAKKEVEILFTNSWHQRWGNFFLRGGLEAVMGFLQIESRFPEARLILRTTWEEPLASSDIGRLVRSHPKITLLDQKLSDAEMFDLFLRADIFCLDAASVHSVSILRAMYCGAACLVSDAPGYEEYASDGQTAIVLPGRRDAVYSVDPGSGWMRDDFDPLYTVNAPRIGATAEVLARLCADRNLRLQLGAAARRSVMTNNSFAGWSGGFESLLREALA